MTKFVPDIISFLGLSLLGYGLYLQAPWVAFAVCGALLIIGGYLAGKGQLGGDSQ